MRYLRSSPIRLILIEGRNSDQPLLRDIDEPGIEIMRVAEAAQALVALEDREFDILVVDGDGAADPVVEHLLAIQRRRPYMAIVVALDPNQEYLSVELARIGLSDYVIKGTLTDLMMLRWLEKSIEHHRLRAELDRAREEARRSSLHDPVTGLANRALFHDSLNQAISMAKRYEHGLAVLYTDLDAFKGVNSSHGHAVGDGLLRIVGERVRASVRDSDMVARIGGDDFAILLRNIKSPEDAGPVASCVLSELSKPVSFVDSELAVTASIGVSYFPSDGISAKELLQHAELAMYTAKGSGRNTFQFFSSGNERRLRLVHDRDALNF
jgi:diguanylate cyclase (GGDEF)-like protein